MLKKEKKISDKTFKQMYANLSEYTDANRVKVNGVVIVHLNKIPELVG